MPSIVIPWDSSEVVCSRRSVGAELLAPIVLFSK